jgi:hypothetical protein
MCVLVPNVEIVKDLNEEGGTGAAREGWGVGVFCVVFSLAVRRAGFRGAGVIARKARLLDM